jgi:hypothetical protein
MKKFVLHSPPQDREQEGDWIDKRELVGLHLLWRFLHHVQHFNVYHYGVKSLFFPGVEGGFVGVLDWQTYQGVTRGSRLCGEDRDRETENSKVCARTQDTRFIQVRVAKVANPTSCLGGTSMAPCAWCWLRSGARLGTRPSFI